MRFLQVLVSRGLSLGFAAAVATGASAQDPRQIVARAATAMGGEAALRGVAVVTADFNTATFALGQEETPASPARATFAYGRVVTDWGGARRAVIQDLRPLTGGVQRQRRVIAGGIGMLETDGRPAPDAPATVAAGERALRLSPERVLLTLLDQPATGRPLPAKEWRGEPHDGLRYAAGPDTTDLYFDRTSGLLTVMEQVTDDPILGDRSTVTWYTRWQEAGSIKLPREIDVLVNGRLQSHTVYPVVATGTTLEAALFAIPDSVAARAQPSSAAAAPVVVQVTQVAPGVWHLTGGSHHSLVVEQPTQLVVVEAPLSTARSRAVMDTLKARFPAKPIGLVVNTHHHWDHASGLRPYIAAGTPIVTHRRNAAFIRQIAAARKTVAPDELSRAPREPVLRLVEDSLVVGEGAGRIVVYHTSTTHVEGMLSVYLPAARLVFNSDLVNPGPTLAPAGASELLAAMQARKVPVERVVGGHGGPAMAWTEVEHAAH